MIFVWDLLTAGSLHYRPHRWRCPAHAGTDDRQPHRFQCRVRNPRPVDVVRVL